ncbi:MAG: glycine--tRNA ligase, partial [Ignavibacteriae bacterium]|nr:glycine--tRNA ligase [Ignavibacteriota bacterium]
GLANNYDYGPYGIQLKNNIRDLWWKKFVTSREDVVGLDGAILMQGKVWEASGHANNFNEALVEDKISHRRYRIDHLLEAWIEKKGTDEDKKLNLEAMSLEELNKFVKDKNVKSPDGNELSDVKVFNQMFETDPGFISEKEGEVIYLRPETAQAIFVNFKNVTDSMRVKIPFGIAQVGKAFRKEITKGQFIFRTIETEQMEIEYFIHPESEWEDIYKNWQNEMMDFYLTITNNAKDDLRFRKHDDEELSHYSKQTFDVEYEFDFGFKEVAGFAHRTDFDLTQHEKFSGQKLQYKDPNTNESYIPHVLEPSFGLARATLIAIYSAYTEEDLGEGKTRTVLKFPAKLAPVTAAVFPLQKDEKLADIAKSIFRNLSNDYNCEYDNAGNIGKMYRRQDEIGTPFCITVDYESMNDNSVTVRDRDTMKQERVKIDELAKHISSKI